MSMLRRLVVASPAALLLLSHPATAAAPPHSGIPTNVAPIETPAERVLFGWRGDVDREATIVIRGRNIQTRGSGIDASLAKYLDVRDALPLSRGVIDVHMANGRGSVVIVQQPEPRNDYTAIVRVRDDRSGRDAYRLVVSWRPIVDVPVRYDPRDNDRGRGGDWDRGRGGDWDRGRGGDWDRGRDGDWDRVRDGDWDRSRDNNRRYNNAMSWRGDVDDVVDIRIQGRRIEYRTRSGQRLRAERFDVRGKGLPKAPVMVGVDVLRGRGNVVVVQQPERRNGFTTIIRVIDKRSGYGDYDFDIFWR